MKAALIIGFIVVIGIPFIGAICCAAIKINSSIQPPPLHQKTVLETDSCGCKVVRIETDGHVFLANNQGGIVEVK